MRPLLTEIPYKGHVLRQLKRTGKVAMYERSKGGRVYGFEVIKIKIAPAHTWPNGNTTPEHEAYPCDNEFGSKGWYFMVKDRSGAEAKFAQLEAIK